MHTALRSLQTAVDQFEWVIRIIEKPFDCGCERANNPNESDADALESVTIDHAFAFLGSLTDLLFLLINRANTIETLYQDFDGDVEEDTGEDNEEIEDKEQCFLTDLFQYLETFLSRFQRALFACRITNLPLIHDEYRIQLLLSIAATGKSIVIRQRAARLLCKLLAVCYEQTGSFQLVKRPIFKVFCSVFFSTRQPALSTGTVREAIEEMRRYSFTEDNVTPAFHLQFKELVNSLITQIKVFEMWQIAMSSPEQLRDYEEIEEGLYRIVRAISPFWLLDEKRIWLGALLRLHEARQKYAEATCCKLECIGFTQQTAQEEERGDFLFWGIKELVIAREFAEKASWTEQQISISEQLLVCLKEQKRYSEYLETLKYLERVIYQNAEAEAMNGGYGAGHAFYRITYTSDCVSTHISKHEYIYKRNKFMSLGEFVTEMKAMLRVKYPMCERVDIVPESKPLTGDDQPNVIFMRITSVEEVKTPERFSSKPQNDPHYKPAVFKFAIPFTLGSSSYGKTSDQMKRITYLSVAQPFPCALNRQVVIERREEIRCPIENSMDDIQKRCFVLQDEINKEVQGRTDLKTLTLVLKGSVDTHVHGGIPEVIDSFLALIPKSQDAANEDDDGSPTQALPPLLDARGKVMSADDSLQKRHHLANLLVHFLKLCWQCLMISREAYRRASPQSSALVAPAPVAPAFAISQLQTAGDPSSPNSSSSMFTSLPAGGLVNFSGNSAKNVNITSGFMAMTPDDDYNLSPLQLEFEKSFASLVELVQSKISFPYQSAGDVTQLRLQMQLKRVGSLAPSIHNASAPLASSSSSGTPFH
uniref:DOCKER domain-containing protein n=1 Tax=Globisporangium ultimum (strain ATCC 200006 / CBS 805.95 / DAOM BR144) TaxID=431595 RepID=K3X541_GLOUD